ncbi:hypothetical protein ACCT30_30015, partial [Rhizobium ruizarguesonis]
MFKDSAPPDIFSLWFSTQTKKEFHSPQAQNPAPSMISQSLEIEGAEPGHHLIEPERSRHRRLGPGKAA